ncbi:hypothetical protein ASA1KI_11070 [Opitutales bacterium ASA1]|uniref:protein kinase domain-containing protein n=1 Tax=Congregicoccus parvus TaxID=3081749 RepID=UPI002B2911A6|nr:hypothetical protein ASA1KI_11070 [Opitutales bacterium ASA1]
MSASELDFGATIRAFSQGQRVFSRFSLIRILGRGGMGVVWLAKDDKLEREVALKFLPEAVALDPRSVDDLKQETRRSLELTHPHIVRIYDFFEDQTAAAISMEFVEGGSLARLAVDQPLRCFEPAQILQWLRQLVDALEYAHTKAKIVHRDLKPANLMISEEGDLKITDFGISATVTDSMTRVSRLMSSGATPAYSSPQQIMGERASPADDIYSLGATIFDLVTGKPPFHSGNLLVQVQSKTPDSMRKRREDLGVKGGEIPESWEKVVAACLAKEPSQRPASARAVLEGLETGRVVVAPPVLGGSSTGEAPAEKTEHPTVPLVPAGDTTRSGGHTPAPPPPPPPPDTGGQTDDKSAPTAAAAFAAAAALLKNAKGPGAKLQAFGAVLAGRAGLLPRLVGAAVPLLLVVLLVWLFAGGKDPEFNAPVYSAGGDAPGFIVPGPNALGPAASTNQSGSLSPNQSASQPPPGRDAAPIAASQAVRPPADSLAPGTATGSAGAFPPSSIPASTPPRTTTSSSTSPPAQQVVPPPPMPPSGTVRIVTEPAGATVVAEGRPIGLTPLELPSVRTGDVAFALRLAGYEDAVVNGRVREDDTLELQFKLRPLASASASVSSTAAAPAPDRAHGLTIPDLGLDLVWLQPGEFVLGSTPEESGPESDEQPQTRVRFSRGFWIGTTEVTQAQWRALMGSSPSNNRSGGDRAPVDRVSWDDAAAFCQRLDARERSAGRVPEGYVYRLPTEAEWEYACRAGTSGPYAGDLGQMAVTGRRTTSPRTVAGLQPNSWGLYDMHGNVAEWTSSWYGVYPGGSVTDYTGPRDGRVRVFRGGSYDSPARNARSAYRGWVSGSTAAPNRGLRVVLAPRL